MGIFSRFLHQTDDAISAAEGEIFAPVCGTAMDVTKVDDPVFSQETLGKGCAIRTQDDCILAPVSGKVTAVIEDSKHAIGITSQDGIEVLIHVGIDTVEMHGEGFEYLVAEGDSVKMGQPCLRFSHDAIKQAGFDDIVIMVVSNSYEYASVTLMSDTADTQTPLLKVEK